MRPHHLISCLSIAISLMLPTSCSGINNNILSALAHPYLFTIPAHEQPLATNISYIFADLKFDGKHLTLCEFGPGTHAGLTTTPVFINRTAETLTSPYWELFWHFLKSFNLPLWRTGGWENRSACQELKLLGGRFYDDVAQLYEDQFFKIQSHKASSHFTHISDAKGIIVSTPSQRSHGQYEQLKKNYPGFIYVNEYTNSTTCTKNKTRKLFECGELMPYTTPFVLCEKKYTNDMASSLIKKIGSEYYIIKPIASMRGNGILMVHKDELDTMLKNILVLNKNQKNHQIRSWQYDKSPTFLVEAYAPSRTITVDGKPYDPTMRLVCFLAHDYGIITIHIVGGYWKTPNAALTEKGSLTEQHITAPHKGHRIPISLEDLTIVKPLCADMMFKAYKKMLTAANA